MLVYSQANFNRICSLLDLEIYKIPHGIYELRPTKKNLLVIGDIDKDIINKLNETYNVITESVPTSSLSGTNSSRYDAALYMISSMSDLNVIMLNSFRVCKEHAKVLAFYDYKIEVLDLVTIAKNLALNTTTISGTAQYITGIVRKDISPNFGKKI